MEVRVGVGARRRCNKTKHKNGCITLVLMAKLNSAPRVNVAALVKSAA